MSFCGYAHEVIGLGWAQNTKRHVMYYTGDFELIFPFCNITLGKSALSHSVYEKKILWLIGLQN